MERATVAVLGSSGTMGGPIARSLLRAGLDVRVWNRTAARDERLGEAGAAVCDAAAEAATGGARSATRP